MRLKNKAFYLPVDSELTLSGQSRQIIYGNNDIDALYQYPQPEETAQAKENWQIAKATFERQFTHLCRHLESLVNDKELALNESEAGQAPQFAKKINSHKKKYIENIKTLNRDVLFLLLDDPNKSLYARHQNNPTFFAEIKFSLEKIVLKLLADREKLKQGEYKLNDKIDILSTLDDVAMNAAAVCDEGAHTKFTEMKRVIEHSQSIPNLMAGKLDSVFTSIGAAHVAKVEKELVELIPHLQDPQRAERIYELERLRDNEIHMPKFFRALAHKLGKFPQDMPFHEDPFVPVLEKDADGRWGVRIVTDQENGEIVNNSLMVTNLEVAQFEPVFDQMFNAREVVEHLANQMSDQLIPLFKRVDSESLKDDEEYLSALNTADKQTDIEILKSDKGYLSAINEANEQIDLMMQEMRHCEKDTMHAVGFFDFYDEKKSRFFHKSDIEIHYWSKVYAYHGLVREDMIDGLSVAPINKTEYELVTDGMIQWIIDKEGEAVTPDDFIEGMSSADIALFVTQQVNDFGLMTVLAATVKRLHPTFGLNVLLSKECEKLKLAYNLHRLGFGRPFFALDSIDDLEKLVTTCSGDNMISLLYTLQNIPRNETQALLGNALLNPKEFLLARDILNKMDANEDELAKYKLPGPQVYISRAFLKAYRASTLPLNEIVIPTPWVGKPPERIPPHFYGMRDYQSIVNLNKYPLEDLFELYPPMIECCLSEPAGVDNVVKALKVIVGRPDRKNLLKELASFAAGKIAALPENDFEAWLKVIRDNDVRRALMFNRTIIEVLHAEIARTLTASRPFTKKLPLIASLLKELKNHTSTSNGLFAAETYLALTEFFTDGLQDESTRAQTKEVMSYLREAHPYISQIFVNQCVDEGTAKDILPTNFSATYPLSNFADKVDHPSFHVPSFTHAEFFFINPKMIQRYLTNVPPQKMDEAFLNAAFIACSADKKQYNPDALPISGLSLNLILWMHQPLGQYLSSIQILLAYALKIQEKTLIRAASKSPLNIESLLALASEFHPEAFTFDKLVVFVSSSSYQFYEWNIIQVIKFIIQKHSFKDLKSIQKLFYMSNAALPPSVIEALGANLSVKKVISILTPDEVEKIESLALFDLIFKRLPDEIKNTPCLQDKYIVLKSHYNNGLFHDVIANKKSTLRFEIHGFRDIENIYVYIHQHFSGDTRPSKIKIFARSVIDQKNTTKEYFFDALLGDDLRNSGNACAVLNEVDNSENPSLFTLDFLEKLSSKNSPIFRIPLVWAPEIIRQAKTTKGLDLINKILLEYKDFIRFCTSDQMLADLFRSAPSLMPNFLKNVPDERFEAAFGFLYYMGMRDHLKSFCLKALESVVTISQLSAALRVVNSLSYPFTFTAQPFAYEIIGAATQISPTELSLEKLMDYYRAKNIMKIDLNLFEYIYKNTTNISDAQLVELFTHPRYQTATIRTILRSNILFQARAANCSLSILRKILVHCDIASSQFIHEMVVSKINKQRDDYEEILSNYLFPNHYWFTISPNIFLAHPELSRKLLEQIDKWLNSQPYDTDTYQRICLMLSASDLNTLNLSDLMMRFYIRARIVLFIGGSSLRITKSHFDLDNSHVLYHDKNNDIYIEWFEDNFSWHSPFSSAFFSSESREAFDEKYTCDSNGITKLLVHDRLALYRRFVDHRTNSGDKVNLDKAVKSIITSRILDRDIIFKSNKIIGLTDDETQKSDFDYLCYLNFLRHNDTPESFINQFLDLAKTNIEQFLRLIKNLDKSFYSTGLSSELYEVLYKKAMRNKSAINKPIIDFLIDHLDDIKSVDCDILPYYQLFAKHLNYDIPATLQACGYVQKQSQHIDETSVLFLHLLHAEHNSGLTSIFQHLPTCYWPIYLHTLGLLPDHTHYSFDWLNGTENIAPNVRGILHGYRRQCSLALSIKRMIKLSNAPKFIKDIQSLLREEVVNQVARGQIKDLLIEQFVKAHQTHRENAEVEEIVLAITTGLRIG